MKDKYKKFAYQKKGKAAAKVKNIKALVKQEVKIQSKKKIETKTINVNSASQPGQNNALLPYGALSGVQYWAQDIFSVKQGPNDSTIIGSANRIGDKIQGVGFLMDYYLTVPSFYTLSGTSYPIPFVKVRITVFKQAYGTPVLNQPLLYDTNFLTTNTSTLQPINWNEGYVKDVLLDKVYIIHQQLGFVPGASFQVPPLSNVFHFRKYIKYDHPIKFNDNSSTAPDSTDMPVNVCISAEVDESFSGLTPSGTKILFSTGYTRAWFKDA